MAAPPQGTSSFTLGGHLWHTGDEIVGKGIQILPKTLIKELCPRTYMTVIISGKFKGKSPTNARMFDVEFTGFNRPVIYSYGAQHTVWKSHPDAAQNALALQGPPLPRGNASHGNGNAAAAVANNQAPSDSASSVDGREHFG
jgi:hypothetical protein